VDRFQVKVTERVQKVTFTEMRAAGVRQVLIYCSDCGHFHVVPDDADRWLADIEDRFVCTVRGQRGADVRPDWQSVQSY
jgi:hypothetical protein